MFFWRGGGVKGDFFDFETCLIDHRSVLDVNCLLSRVRGAGLFFSHSGSRGEKSKEKKTTLFFHTFLGVAAYLSQNLYPN